MIEDIVALLAERNETITFAESCTGGKLSAALVDIPDASKVFHAGVVTYSNEAKMTYLNVQAETLAVYGAVSEETAREMAIGAAKVNHADYAISVSGIAGPTGGTPEKPVGTVCFGYWLKDHVVTETMHFGSLGRNKVRDCSVTHAYETLLKYLKKDCI